MRGLGLQPLHWEGQGVAEMKLDLGQQETQRKLELRPRP